MAIAIRRLGQAFGASTYLGWQVSSNWTSPLRFAVYSILRPVSGALILAVMYTVITGGRPGSRAYLSFLVIGVAFWSFVQNGFADFANAVLEDRGYYRMLKYVYISPVRLPVYLLGRGLAQLGTGVSSAGLVLVIAALLLHLPIDPARVDYGLLALSCAIAFIAVVALAGAFSMILLAGRDAYGYGEMAAQSLYIISGAIFPITVLPGVLAAVAQALPLVYWLELVRRALLGPGAVRMLPGLSDGEVLVRLVLTTILLIAVAFALYRWADRAARRRGLIDMESNW